MLNHLPKKTRAVTLFRRTISALREHGPGYVLREALPHVHNHYVRKHLPRSETKLNGVKAKYQRLGDGAVPWQAGHPNRETYEDGILSALRENLLEGEDIVIVGAGWGISAVEAAQLVGESGTVKAYEASQQQARYARETLQLNGVEGQVELIEQAVGTVVSTYDGEQAVDSSSPEALPSCDVLELDCEGAEISILERMDIEPRLVVVETHGVFGAPTDEVTEILEERGYRIESVRLAESGGYEDMCIENDVRVLTAVHEDIGPQPPEE